MSQNSAIEWTESTWNPVRGVQGHAYEQGFDLRLVPEKLDEPLRRKKPTTYFVNSMSDLFQEGVPDEYIDRVFEVMALTPRHTYQVLTKRAERMRALVPTFVQQHTAENGSGWPLRNVWLGVSVENQHFKSRIDDLRETPAVVHFLSIEPLLEDIGTLNLRGIQWVIVGGESGPGARPFDVAWARSIIAQCKASGVPVFVKQLGAHPVGWWSNSLGPRVGRFTSSKGGDMAEWPEDLRVRKMPQIARKA